MPTDARAMNIYQRINAVMKEITYIKKDAQITGGGANYAAVTHDNVVALTRKHFVAHGIVIYPEQIASEVITARDLNAKVAVKMMLWAGFYHINFVNIDNPNDRIVVKIEAHAADNGDKAPGKAVSYATKSAVLKVLQIETGVNDESRTFEPVLYRPEEKEEFDMIIADSDHMACAVFHKKVSPEVLGALMKSFETGTVTQNRKKVSTLNALARETFEKTIDLISKGCDGNPEVEDSEVIESFDEFTSDEKKILWPMLNLEEQNYIKKIKE